MENEKPSISSLALDGSIIAVGIPAYATVHGIAISSKGATGSYFRPSKEIVGKAVETGFSRGAIIGSVLGGVAFFGARYVATYHPFQSFQEKVMNSREDGGRAR